MISALPPGVASTSMTAPSPTSSAAWRTGIAGAADGFPPAGCDVVRNSSDLDNPVKTMSSDNNYGQPEITEHCHNNTISVISVNPMTGEVTRSRATFMEFAPFKSHRSAEISGGSGAPASSHTSTLAAKVQTLEADGGNGGNSIGDDAALGAGIGAGGGVLLAVTAGIVTGFERHGFFRDGPRRGVEAGVAAAITATLVLGPAFGAVGAAIGAGVGASTSSGSSGPLQPQPNVHPGGYSSSEASGTLQRRSVGSEL
jgi:hypothetical protein